MAASSTNEVIISSLRGGLNTTDPPSALAEDQCTIADNVEFFYSYLGERRAGCAPLDMTSSTITQTIVHLSQWFPTNLPTLPEYWAIGITPGVSATVAKNIFTTWTPETPNDAIDLTNNDIYGITSQSLNGKLFWSYHSAQDRLHIWDGTNWRRTGVAQPNAPTGADHGSGTYGTVRYFRVRYIEKNVLGTIVRRSEPSLSLTFTPSGSGDGVTITKPATVSENETHWELEASMDNFNFYRIQTIAVATTTYLDTTAAATGYANQGPISEIIGTYLLQRSAKYMTVDGDRLILGGHWTDTTAQSLVSWSPVFNDPGVGNDERLPLQVNNTLNLDGFEGGPITGLASATYGLWYAFKWGHIYQLTRTGDITAAYDVSTLSKTRGAIPGTVIQGADENGYPCIYFLDPLLGPSRIGTSGIQIIRGLRNTWATINLLANIVGHGVYYGVKQQIHWWVSTNGASTPNMKLVLQVSEVSNQYGRGTTRGWSTASGLIANAYCSAALTENVFLNGSQSLTSRPYIGLPAPNYIQRCDVNTTDAGTPYNAVIQTRPYIVAGLLTRWGAMVGQMLATALQGTTMVVRLIRDFGVETSVLHPVDLSPSGTESLVVKTIDDLVMSSARSIQIQFSDT